MTPSFDPAALMDRVDGDLEFLAETVEMLESDGPRLMADLRAAAAAGDAAAVGRAAHALKGMVANFCAADVQRRAADVEQLGKGGDLASAPAAADELGDAVGALVNDLRAFVAKAGA